MSRGSVLVVDDDRGVREMLCEFLVVRGYAATPAGDGATALALVDQVHPDVVLLDMLMPGMDGVETLRRLVAAHPMLPVVMVTANVDVRATSRVLTSGAADYVPKPLDFDYLDQVLAVQVAAATAEHPSAVLELGDGDLRLPFNLR